MKNKKKNLEKRIFTTDYMSVNGAVDIRFGAIATIIKTYAPDVDVLVNGVEYTLPLADFEATTKRGKDKSKMPRWSDICDELDGYTAHNNQTDFDIATADPCPCCFGKMAYEGYKHGSSYRAFAICNSCDVVIEF